MMRIITSLLLLQSAWGENFSHQQYGHLPGWLENRVRTISKARNDCQYSCSEGGSCTVRYRGYTLGKCEPSGVCVGTPKKCQDCKNAINCPSQDVPYEKEISGKPYQQSHMKEHVNFKDVMEDLKILMTDSKEFWPADFGHYGPLFIRYAWHTSGSYRASDGRGGADGARIRFSPERSWDDNTNLDKAQALLWPVKMKYGKSLSWGDLIILAGNVAIESMGGPSLGFCGGRVDAEDGSESVKLGPSPEQEELMPCEVNGKCQAPLGTSTIGLIYVNPEGPMGNPSPEESADDIREVFGRMGMNDSETVALIGGGHTFGKCHGPCTAGPGPSPLEDPENPWPGMCGSGKGKDAYTSGFELIWTTTPYYWNNEYFQNLLNLEWHLHKGPGNKHQWEPRVISGIPPQVVSAYGTINKTIGLLTSDVALRKDIHYQNIVRQYGEDQAAFDHAWKHAWYKLTTRDMGPASRCVNDDAPPPQPFQYPLPEPPRELANFEEIKGRIKEVLERDVETIGKFTRLAWQCSSTFRSTDYLGGCNGARIRFSPQKNWPGNINIEKALQYLKPIKMQFEGLSWADLIVLAGNTALETAGGKPQPFCGGRTDAIDGWESEFLFPKIVGDFSESLVRLKDYISIMGLTKREFAALNGVGYAIGDSNDCDGLYCKRNSFEGHKSVSSSLSNIFFLNLLSDTWEEHTIRGTGKRVYKSNVKHMIMLRTDLMFLFDPELLTIAQDFASDNDLFLTEAAKAWTKLMTADRFDGPTGNLCYP